METKFKVGDKVLLNKPKCPNNNILFWGVEMERYIGDILEVIGVDADIKTYYCEGEDFGYWFCESWLTKVEEGIITEEPKAKETKPIDWEARRWEMASKFWLDPNTSNPESAIGQADAFIEHYKQTTK